MPESTDKNAAGVQAQPRAVSAIYSHAQAALLPDRKSIAGRFVILAFSHDTDLSLPTRDSDRVQVIQLKSIQTHQGKSYPAGPTAWSNSGDKVLKIDASRVYCTGWSMGARTSLGLMAKHPETFAAGLIIAGQQRPRDVATLANQKLMIITGSEDDKATPWNEKCVPIWEQGRAKVTHRLRFSPRS